MFRDSQETPLAEAILALVAFWRGGSHFACFGPVTLMRAIWTQRCWVSVQATLLRKLASVPTQWFNCFVIGYAVGCSLLDSNIASAGKQWDGPLRTQIRRDDIISCYSQTIHCRSLTKTDHLSCSHSLHVMFDVILTVHPR